MEHAPDTDRKPTRLIRLETAWTMMRGQPLDPRTAEALREIVFTCTPHVVLALMNECRDIAATRGVTAEQMRAAVMGPAPTHPEATS